ncbi:PucR family transcriptional regulator [Actinomadura hibisca]|uniref:PucR family transcriptional regulator n=1 Tax=Actinomadura hibisca TaxID=68565 RepID=UPI0009FF5B0F|nr:PucR family transcriptional regulator [Actinomadura hibisca]
MSDLSQAVPLPQRRIELGLSFDCADRIAADLRDHVPGIAAEAARRIEKELPEFLRPQDPRYAEALGLGVEYAIGHFLELMADPDVSSADILRFWRRIGAGEASEGRSLDAWQAAMRIGAGVAVERLTEYAEILGHRASAATVAAIANAVFGYINQLAAVVAEGHADAENDAAGTTQGQRRRLLDLLLTRPVPDQRDLAEVARRAAWPLPRTVAAVALRERRSGSRAPALPTDLLSGLHLAEPCLVVPDPDGPGRAQALERHLRGWSAAVGPTVEVAALATSLRWARQALELAAEGLIDDGRPVIVEQHMPIIVMMQERELVERVIQRRLAPLFTVRPAQRYRLAETLLVSLECGFNATEVAGRLHLHAQTVRYRLRQLGELFGDTLHATSGRLELHMALEAWLTLNAEAAPCAQLRTG